MWKLKLLNLKPTLEVARIALSFAFLVYASWSDIKTREVSNKVWFLYAPSSLTLTLIEGLLYEDYNYWLSAGISVALTFALAISLFYLGAFGGADAKAFMCLALAFPTYPKFSWNTHITRLHYLFPITIFTNSILLAALSIIYMLLRNFLWKLKKGRKLFEGLEKEPFWKKILTVLCGYKVSIEKLKEKDFYFPLEDVKENKDGVERFIVVFPGDRERSGILARLEDYIEKGMIDRYIWASPGLPMLVFITLGFIVALFFGDLVWLLVSSLFFSLKL